VIKSCVFFADEEHIYNGDVEAILKILWEIIKFYHICKCSAKGTVEDTMLIWFQAILPVLSSREVNNFVTDWCDGILLCHLIEMLEPGLCPQYSVLAAGAHEKAENCEFAIKHAKSHFGIPTIINTDMLLKGNLDEKSMMIYLAFFIQHAKRLLLTWLQTILPDSDINNLTTDWCDGKNLIALCNTLCFRVLPTWQALDSQGAKENFINVMKVSEENLRIKYSEKVSLEMFSDTQIDEFISSSCLYYFRYAFEKIDAGKCKLLFENQQRVNVGDPIKFFLEYSGTNAGEVTLYGRDPRPAKIIFNDPTKDQQTYCIKSGPTKLVGSYEIAVYWNKISIPGSPFTISVGNPKSATVKSLPEHVSIGEIIVFEIDTTQAGNGIVAIKAINPGSSKEDIIFSEACGSDVVKERYIPSTEGTVEFMFTFNGVIIKQQKCTVMKTHLSTVDRFIGTFAEHCIIQHKYLNNDHCLVNPKKPSAVVKFSVDATNAGEGSLTTTVMINGKQIDDMQVHSIVDKSKGVEYDFSFIPQKLLKHTVTVRWNGHDIPGTPFEVNVIDHTKCKPNKNDLPIKPRIDGKYGKAILNQELKFKIDTNGAGNGKLQSIISQPDHKNITLIPVSISKSGTYMFVYKPCEVGRFDIILYYSKTHINTYKCYTVPSISYDPGIIVLPSHSAFLFEPFEFYIKGNQSYNVIVYDPQNKKIIPEIKRDSCLASFIPKFTGSYVMFELDNKQRVPNSSSVIQCIHPRKCKFLQNRPKYLQVGEATEYKVTSAGAGLGVLSVLINGNEDDQMCAVTVNTQQDECLHSVTFRPKLVGKIYIQVFFAGKPISNFDQPQKVKICDAKNCKTIIETKNCLVWNPFTFQLHTAGAGFGKAFVKAHNSSNEQETVDVIKSKNGPLQCVFFPAEIGEYSIDVIWGAVHVPGSPFKILVEKPISVLCLAIGSGLNKAIAGKPAKFYITAESGLLENKDLFVSIRSINHDHKLSAHIKESSAGHYDVEYTASIIGKYEAQIKRHGKEIIFSPFKIDVIQGADASKCVISKINPDGSKYTNFPLRFYVDTSKGGNGVLNAIVKDPYNKELDVFIKGSKDDKVMVTFIAENEGTHTVSVLWSNIHVPGSPLELQVQKLAAASKVYAHGHGLKNGRLGKSAEFIVETKDAGPGDLTIYGLSTEGLFNVCTELTETSGTYRASYEPTVIGDVFITVQWGSNRDHVPGSPFRVSITTSDILPLKSINSSDFEIQGLPLENDVAWLNTDITYTVNTRVVIQGKFESIIARPGQKSIILTPINDEGTTFQYRPCEVGKFFIMVRYSIISRIYACVCINNNKTTETGVLLMPDRIAFLKQLYTFYIQGGPTYTAVVYNPKNEKIKVTTKDPPSPVAEFVPKYTGSYVILEVNKGRLIPNSSFVLQCIDPSKCKVLGDLPTTLQVGKTEEFVVTSADAGLGVLSVLVNDEEDNQLCTAIVNTHQDSRHHKVTLKPRFVGNVFIKLLFVGLTIPQFETPFKVQICDASKCKIIMPSDVCVFGEKFTFILDTTGAGSGRANFEVYHSDNQPDKDTVSIIDNRDGSFQCTYIPADIGDHKIDVIWGIDHVKGCPFKFMVEKPAGKFCLAIGSGLNRAEVGKPAKFYISAVNHLLNRKDLSISIKTIEHECAVNIDETSGDRYDVTYTALKFGQYEATIKYCDEDIIFSPFKINVIQGTDTSKCKIFGINSQGVYAKDLLEFYVETPRGEDGTLRIVVTDAKDKQLDVFIKNENKERHCIAFIPENEGTHTISVLWCEAHVPQSPLRLNIVAVEKMHAYGQGLLSGKVGQRAVFTVVTSNVGKSGLKIHGFSTERTFGIETTDKGDGILEANYVPLDTGDISINIAWFDIPIPGSPFTVHITPDSAYNYQSDSTYNNQPDLMSSEVISQNDFDIRGLPLQNNIAYLNTEVSYIVNTTRRDFRHGTLNSTVFFPNHKSYTPLPTQQKFGEYKFQFTPSKVGKFEIAVCCSNTHLCESPYTCIAIDKDASGVIYMSGNVAQVGVPYEFYIQGSQSYSAVLYDPHNQRVRNVTTSKQKYSTIARFTPQLTGSYAIFEENNGQQISKNSYTLHCVDPNKCEMLGDLSKFLQVGRTARFKVISCGAGPGNITVKFEDEKSNQICHKTVEQSHYVHTVTLQPILVGSISIKIAFSGVSIPKMPLKIEICDAYRCKVLGDLTGKYPAGKEISFSLLTAGAGRGTAIIRVQSPTNHEYTVNTIESEKNILKCTFTPVEIGDHSIDVMWGIEHVLGSPFDFTVVKSSEIVCITGLGHLRWAIANVPAKFSLQADEGGLLKSGALSVTVKSNHLTYEAQVKCEDVGDGIYNITYVAPQNGSYLAEIKHHSKNITGSPFKINVFDGDATDSAETKASKCRITVQTEDLHHTNTPIEFPIDTSQADYCVPDVTLSDPNGHQADTFTEKNENGYLIKFIPEIEGTYTMIVLISGHHVRGSPFKLHCMTRNAKMVKVDGEGLCHSKLGEWAEFTVDTEDAGQGVLTITAVSKNGPFNIEYKPEYIGSSRYKASYNPPSAAEIFITIKWSDVEIPNSPFKVVISNPNGYEPVAAAVRRPTTVIVNNPGFDPSNIGPDMYNDEDDIPKDISSLTDSDVVEPDSDLDSDDDIDGMYTKQCSFTSVHIIMCGVPTKY